MSQSAFTENYHGVLTHDGAVKVAKTHITAKILNISKRTVQVKGNKGSYHCEIHKDLYPFMKFIDVGDTAFVKWKQGKSWFVGFQKQTADITEPVITGDEPVSENTDWMDFFQRIDAE